MLHFREITINDAQLLLDWRRSERVTKFMMTDIDNNIELQKKWILQAYQRKDYYHWIICAGEKSVGYISLSSLDIKKNYTSSGMYIGEEEFTRIGGYAIMYLLNYIFFILHMEKIYAEVFKSNNILKMLKILGYEVMEEKETIKNGAKVEYLYLELTRQVWLTKIAFHRYTTNIPVTLWLNNPFNNEKD